MDEQLNVEEEESSSKTVQSEFLSDYAPVLDDSSSLVEPVSSIAAKIDDTVVSTVGEPLAAAEEDFSGDAEVSELEVLGVGDETLLVGGGEDEDELDGGALGSEVVGVEGVKLVDVSELEALLPCSGSVEEVEAQERGELVAVVETVMTEDGWTDVAKVEDDENGGEVVEEVLNFGVRREGEEPVVGDSLPVDARNGGIEAMLEEKAEIKANEDVEDDDIKATEEVEKDEIKAVAEVGEDEVKAIEEVENDDIKATEEVEKDDIKTTEEIENEKDEIETMQDEGDEIKAMEEGHEIKTMEEEVEKDEVEAMEQFEKDETEAMEEVEKDDGEGESVGVEDDMDLVGIKKGGEGESVAVDDDEDETLAVAEEDVPEVEMETPESVKSTGGGKRKRGKSLKGSTTRSPASRKTIEEDVCFICFDGGDLVLCDRR